MAQWSHGSRTLFAKLVYYGPALGGKTTNLQELHRLTDPEGVSRLLSVATADDRTPFFDLLPFELGEISGYKVAIKLYTVPGQVRYDSTRRVVLAGADAVVFVADSSSGREAENRGALENLHMNMLKNRLTPASVPVLFQFNKQDLPEAASPETVARWLGADAAKGIPAVARQGRGVLETLVGATRLMLLRLASVASPRAKQDFDPAAIEEHLERAFGPHLKRLEASGGASPARPARAEASSASIVLSEGAVFEQSVEAGVVLGEKLAAESVRAARLEREAEALRALSDALCRVGASFDRGAIVDASLDAAGGVLGGRAVTLLREGRRSAVEAERTLSGGQDPLLGSASGRLLAARLLGASSPAIVDDLAADIGAAAAGAFRAAASAPVPSDAPLAIVAYAAAPDGAFGAHDLRFLSTVAQHLAAGLDKARIHAELASHRDHLDALVKSRTRALRDAYSELKDLDRMKDRFLSNLSHEMRTPVTSILASAGFLRDYEGSPEERREMIESIIEASRALDGLIGGLLRVARMESGSETLDLARTEPREIAARAIELSGREGVTVEGAPDLAPMAADSERLSRALANLFDNAVKFSPPGSPVTVRVAPARLKQADNVLDAVAFSVLDRGSGPAGTDAERLFAPFEQGGDLLTSKPKGVGLGLHEARCIARMHGGSLKWQARSDGGSELLLVVPSRRVRAREAALA